MEPRSLRVPGAHDLSLNVLEWSREGVPLLLVHGFSNEAHIWDDLAPELAPHYRVLAVDLRGHGDSDWDPEQRYDYPEHVADLEALCEHLGLERMVLVGHSLGGRVCTLFGGRHPEKVAGFALVDSGPELDRRGTVRISLDVRQHADPSFGSVAEYETVLSSAYAAARPAAIARMARHGLRQRDDGRYVLKMDPALRGAAGRKLSEEDLEEREARLTREMWRALAALECPVLVVRGAASDILSADAADTMVDEVLKNGRLAVVPQAGHSVMTDNPQVFRDVICQFALGD